MNKEQKVLYLHQLYKMKSIGVDFIEPLAKKDDKTPKSLKVDFEKLSQIANSCHLCELSKTRKNVVFGYGNTNATIMFIGEAPGANEDEQGLPFVGRAGDILTKIIENVLELKRSDVYIANIIKCRPPNNRVPNDFEASMCLPYIHRQIELVNPKIIVLLGTTSYKYLLKDSTPISKVRGQVFMYKNIKVIPTYHPSYLLRNESAKKDVYIDMLKVKGLL